MPDIDHEAIAYAIVIQHLSDEIEYCAVYEHEDAEDWSEEDCKTIHGLACEQLRAIPSQLDKAEPRTMTTVAELEALPIGSVILLEYGVIAQAICGDEDVAAIAWAAIGKNLVWSSARVVEYAGKGASFTVLYVPEAVA